MGHNTEVARKFFITICGLFLIMFFCPWGIYADEPDATAILGKADRARGNTSGLVWDISIVAQEGSNTTSRSLTVKAKDDNSLATFSAPADVKGQMLLMKQNNMWFVKPGLSKPINISPRQRLIGGASNADIAATNYVGDYNAVITGAESIDNEDCYVMDLTAKNTNVSYDKIKYWVSKTRNVGVKAEFYSVSGKLLKTAYFKYDQEIEISGEKVPFVSEMKIEDAMVTTSVTVMTYSNIKITTLTPSDFSLDNLMM